VIADVVNYALAGIGVIHAAARLFVRKAVTADQNTVMTQNWTRRRDQCREQNSCAPTKAP
jgi:hypothetical protein